MTGYRAYNRVFAKTMPVLSEGFQIETELSIHAVDKRWRIGRAHRLPRPPRGPESKLSTFGDGSKVLKAITIAVQGLPAAGAVQLGGAAVRGAGPGRRRAGHRAVRGDGPGAPHPHDARQPGARRLRRPLLRDGPDSGHGRQEPPPPVGDRRVQGDERLLPRVAAGALTQAFVE